MWSHICIRTPLNRAHRTAIRTMDKSQHQHLTFFLFPHSKPQQGDVSEHRQLAATFKCSSTWESKFIASGKKKEKKEKIMSVLHQCNWEENLALWQLAFLCNINITGWHNTRFKHFPCLELDLLFHWYRGAFNLHTVTYQYQMKRAHSLPYTRAFTLLSVEP